MRVSQFTMKVLTIVLLLGPAALAQTSSGSIFGVVRDQSGAVIPGSNVTVTNVNTGINSLLVTDASGRYRFPILIPGSYEIQVQATSFQTGVRRAIQLTVGSSLEINMELQVGEVMQQTVVTAEAPMVETGSSIVSGLVDDRTIRELPLNGRSFDQLIALQSSAPTFRARSPTGAGHGMSAVYTVGGARTRANLFLIDGTEMVSVGTIHQLPGGALGNNMGVDAVQEFVVLSSNYSAAYGKKGGGIINIATRSGTNDFHGSAFEFHRNAVLDARNFFDPNPEPPPFKRNQFGGALGGPIRKDRSFFFGSYEGLREGLGLTRIAVVPDENARQGLLPDRNTGRMINVGVSPKIQPYLTALYPSPNGLNFGDGSAEYVSNPNQISSQDFFLVRFDQRVSDKNSFTARYNFTRASRITPLAIPIIEAAETNRDQVLTLELKRAEARTVNVFRFGFTRGHTTADEYSTVNLDPSLHFLPGVHTVGGITFAAGTAAAILTGTGVGNTDNRYVMNQFDMADQVFHSRGPHAMQFGVQVQRIQNNQYVSVNGALGTFQFVDLAGFLAGTPRQFQGLAPGGNDPTKAYRRIYFAPYFQDDYKMLPNLTLNLGLRYELLTVPVEASGDRISNFHRQFVDGFMIVDSFPTVGSPFWQGNHKGFAPRIGFAWDPSSKGKLAVRGGFGMFYDQIDAEHLFFTMNNTPFVTLLTATNPPFPDGFAGGGASAPRLSPDVLELTGVPTRLQYSFGIQRQITPSSVLKITYVGSRSYRLTRQWDTNTARPQMLAGGIPFYPAGSPRLNPALDRTRSVTTDANSFYNSLQLDFVQRNSHGLRYGVSYTYAKNMDDASVTTGSQGEGGSQSTHNVFDRKSEYGLSVFDVRQNLVANFTYDIPRGNLSGFTGGVMGGWQLGSIVTLSTGTPFSVLTGFNRSRDLSRYIPDRPDLKAGANNNPVLGGPDRYFDPTAFELQPAGFYGNLGRNTVIGPGFANVDLILSKFTSVSERLKVDFRAEFFNLFNRANFALPRIQVFQSNGAILGTAGRIQGTVATSRQIQFGMKLIF